MTDNAPVPLVEATLIVIACDDGRTRRVDPGNVEPEGVA